MGKIDSYLKQIEAAPDGPQIAALFDFDGTIIAGYSAMSLLQEKFKRREMGLEEIIQTANVMSQYSMGGISFSGLMSSAAKFMKGTTEESFREFGEELYEKYIARKVYPETRAIIRAHQAKGHTVAIISSATIYQIEPTARDLDIEHIGDSRKPLGRIKDLKQLLLLFNRELQVRGDRVREARRVFHAHGRDHCFVVQRLAELCR